MKLHEARAAALGRPYRILSVEDSSLDAELMQRHLEAGELLFDFHRVWTRDQFEECLRAQTWDVILADHVLPAFDGDTALEISRELAPETPFIFVSGTLGEELAVEALRRGAKDYVVKQRLSRLPPVVQRAVSEAREHELSLQVEDRLRDTQRRLEAVLNNATVSVFVMDEGQRCIYMNAAAEELTGYRLAEAKGRVLHDVIHHTRPDGSHFPLHECPIDRAFPEDNQVRGEEVFVHKDGHFFPVSFTASPIRDDTSETIGTIIEVRDISAERAIEARRQSAETALRESEERFRNMADHAPVMMWVTDPVGYCTYLNRSWYNFTGQTQAEAEGFGWLDAIHPDDRDEASRVFLEANTRQLPFRLEYRLRRADGEYRWAIDAASPRFGEDGVFCGYIGSVIDIDERREAEDALKASEERYRALFENIEAGFCIIELKFDDCGRAIDYRFAELNPAFERQTGLSNAAGEWVSDIVPDLEGHWFETYGQVARKGEPARFESYAEPFRRWFDVYAFRAGEAHEHRVAILFNDITERHRAEDALRELNETLEQRVEQAVAEREHAQEALRQSQKMEAMGQLTGGVAHDFNNLLTPIVGSLDMLQRKGLGTERDQRLIAGAMQSAEKARTLVQRLLAFARRQPLQAVSVDIVALVNGMADLVASTTGPQIRVVVDAPENLPPAKADPNQLEMALLNLSVNARDAMPEGGLLRISANVETVEVGRGDLCPGSYIRLSVADTGTGMDEATAARAIEPFFSTKGIGKGTGLGLSMVHGLASQLGGSVTIQSSVGLGTNVTLWLPQSATEPANAEVGPVSPAEGLTRGAALLVDDEELVRLSTAEMLSELGYKVIEADSGEDALKLIREGVNFDLLVTDHLMPGMTGTELATAVRMIRPTLPALLVSGYAENEGLDPNLPRLTKPFRKDELASVLAELPSAA